ncbi:hypothetical protein ACHAXR_007833 [Thalassiosira sp. AJA248-18]
MPARKMQKMPRSLRPTTSAGSRRCLLVGILFLMLNFAYNASKTGFFFSPYSKTFTEYAGEHAPSGVVSISGEESVWLDVAFKGSSNFLSLLRRAHKQKIANPSPHCLQQYNNATNLQNQNLEIRRYNRAIEIDFVGRDAVSSVLPTWSAEETSSCQFAAMAFRPTNDSLDEAMRQKMYVSAFYTPGQCMHEGVGAINWGLDLPLTCKGINFGGVLGGKTRRECVDESSGGYPVKMWLLQNSKNGMAAPLKCLKQFLKEDMSDHHYYFDVKSVELSASNSTIFTFHREFGSLIAGFGRDSDLDWNTATFQEWSKAVLLDSVKRRSTNNGTEHMVMKAIARLIGIFKVDRNFTTVNKTFIDCVEELIPPINTNIASDEAQRYWKERGVHLTASTMAEAPSSLLRSFPGSLRSVLPPPPTAVYSLNSVLAREVVNVPFESYVPGCSPFWWVLSTEKNILPPFVEEAVKKNISALSSPTETPRVVREQILHSCSEGDQSLCPFPTYDIVIDVSQVYCGGFFHWEIEIWPRIAPFLDGLNAMPDFAIRIGCEIKDFHPKFFDLIGLSSPKVTIIGLDTVFAKEVIVPTEGFAHTPFLNYWNLVSVRRHIERRIGGTTNQSTQQSLPMKTVLVIVRDASRRGDGNIYGNIFFQQLTTGLGPGYNVTAYRSSDAVMMGCLECQVRAFMAADVVIGSHGAGLSHLLFAKRGGTVLERIEGHQDSSIYSELSFLMGLKYFPMANNAGWDAYRDIILFAADL